MWKGKGTPAPLELVDKTIAAFGAGLIVSLLVVWHQLYSVLLNIQELESKSKEGKLIKFILDHLMLRKKYSSNMVLRVLIVDKAPLLSEKALVFAFTSQWSNISPKNSLLLVSKRVKCLSMFQWLLEVLEEQVIGCSTILLITLKLLCNPIN